MIRLAFDIGGTFTDFVLEDTHTGARRFLKVPTTPADLAEAVEGGLATLIGEAEIRGDDVEAVLHATTVATNAIIERKGSHTALLTTEGFRDVLIIGRQKRYETYDLYMEKPRPLVRRRDSFEVIERIGFDGEVIKPLDAAALDRVLDQIAETGVEAVAVSLLHSYANPAHERAVAERLAARLADLAVSLSSDVSPKFREYERTNTTAANSYVKPIVDRYVGRLEGMLAERSLAKTFLIMQSSGGLVSPEFARAFPVRIVESGPAAGVLMCGVIGAEAGEDRVLSFDMGGTTAKLGAIEEGEPAIAPTFEVDLIEQRKGSGLPLSVPAVELMEIGAGGGSIASLEMGVIKVGPESAGAEPGPVCYGGGGERPTVTDANLVLGYLNPDYFNGGAMPLDADAARQSIERELAQPLGVGLAEAAWGVHVIANSNMEHALRVVSVERGRDPRRYALVAFGGAGPVHAARLARALGIPRVIVPAGAGLGSAIGLLDAAPRIDVSLTRVMPVAPASTTAIREVYEELERRGSLDLERLRMAGEARWQRYAEMRYQGQGFEIRVELPAGPIDANFAERAIEAFRAAYAARHRYRDDATAVEAVDWALVATLPGARRGRSAEARIGADDGGGARGARQAYFPELGGYVETPCFERADLRRDEPVPGPAIIEDPAATTVVLPGEAAVLTGFGHVSIRPREES